jgi:hypothetical protein
MKYLWLLLTVSCSGISLNGVWTRSPAQTNYTACHEIEEELLVREVDYRSLPKTYASVKQHVFQNHCASCHFGEGAYAPRLDQYESTLAAVNVVEPQKSPLWVAVESGKMPPSAHLRSRDQYAFDFLKAWVEERAPR